MPTDAFQHQIAGLGIWWFYAPQDIFVPEMRFHLDHIRLDDFVSIDPPIDKLVFVVAVQAGDIGAA